MDTIALQVGIENLTNEQIDKVEQVLKDKEVRTKEDGRRSFFGWLGNMMVSFNWKGLYLEGSISRFFYGDNQYSLNFFTLREAIDKLSNELGIDFYSAKVLKVHIAENLMLECNVRDYFSVLGNKSRYDRSVLRNGIKYFAGNIEISFYNKIKEVKKNGREVLPVFEHKNVARLEYRFLSHSTIAELLKVKIVTLEELVANYGKLIGRWVEAFQSIHKIHSKISIDTNIFAVKNGLEKYVMINGIEALGGILEISEFIERGKRAGYFKKYGNVSSNLLNKFKKLSSTPLLTTPSNLADELERKVNLIKFYHSYSGEVNFTDV